MVDPIILGGTLSLSGRYAEVGKRMEHGYRLREMELQDQGGLLGRPVRLQILDDESDPHVSKRLYEHLLDEQKVDLIVSPYGGEIADIVADVTESYRYPMVVCSVTPEIWERGRRYVVGVPKTARRFLEGAIDLAATRGYRRVAIIGEDTVFTTSSAKGAQALAQERGLDVVLYDTFPKATTNFSGLLLKVKQQGADVLLVYAFLEDSVAIMRQLKALDVDPKLCAFTAGALLPEFVGILGPLADYVLGPTPWEPVDLGYPGAMEFVARFESRYGSKPSGHTALAYASLLILEKAVEKAGRFDREAVRQALFDLEDRTFFGDYKVDPKTGEQIGKIMHMYQIQEGKRRVIWPEFAREVEPILPQPAWQSR